MQSQASHHPHLNGIVLDIDAYRFRSSFLPIQTRHGGAAGSDVTASLESRGPEAWARRIRAFGIDAAPESETYRAALILLAALEVGQNIDRLARRTGAPRPLVAKCARRLVDNGVWTGGQTVALWAADPTAGSAFERDVAVAMGTLLRRIGPNGRMEWAEAGRWNKSFERVEDASSSATYVDAAPRGAAAVSLAEELDVSEAGRAAGSTAPPVAASEPAASAPASPSAEPEAAGTAADEDAGTAADEDADAPPTAPSLDQVFSNAVWLR